MYNHLMNRKLITFVVLVIIIFFSFVSFFIYAGGYWENLPVLNNISGTKRLAQYIDPLPNSIYAVKGGYTGFPHGIIITRFKYTGEFDENRFLKDWEMFEESGALDSAANIRSTKTYKKVGSENVFLLINENISEGVLFVE